MIETMPIIVMRIESAIYFRQTKRLTYRQKRKARVQSCLYGITERIVTIIILCISSVLSFTIKVSTI